MRQKPCAGIAKQVILLVIAGQLAERVADAAEQGDACGAFNLAVSFADGIGVDKDEKQAAEWYGKSAEAGHSAGQRLFARRLETGKGVAQDEKSGTKLQMPR